MSYLGVDSCGINAPDSFQMVYYDSCLVVVNRNPNEEIESSGLHCSWSTNII